MPHYDEKYEYDKVEEIIKLEREVYAQQLEYAKDHPELLGRFGIDHALFISLVVPALREMLDWKKKLIMEKTQ